MNASTLPRRTFLSLSAALAAGAAGWPLLGGRPDATASTLEPGMEAVPSFCEICFWKCGIEAWKNAQGELVAIKGQAINPLSNGRLCPRGTGGIGAVYDDDRIRRPMLREGDRWREVDWSEALDFIAGRMRELAGQYGSGSMALVSHGYGASFFKHLMKGFGAPVTSAPSYAQCRGARDAGFSLTFGEAAGSPERTDLANSTFAVFIGYHLGENMHNTQVQELAMALDRGIELAVVDPRFSVAAGKARYWMPIKPGTDLALLLAWIRLLVNEKWYNRDFVAQHTYGLEQLQAAVAPYTPEWAYTQTGIEPDVIREVARKLGMHGSTALVHPGRRYNWYGDDTQRARAVAILNALLGNWGRPGGFYYGQKFKVGPYPGLPAYPKVPNPLLDKAREAFPFATQIPTQYLRDHILAGGDPPIKGLMVYGSDLLNNLPHPRQTVEALKKLELLVVVDTHPIELTGWADVVLPDTTYLERYDDLFAPLWREPFLALRQPVVQPRFQSRPSWWIARELGLRLGLEAYFPWKRIEDYLEARLATVGLTLEEMKRRGTVRGKPRSIYRQVTRYRTPTGKVELYSTALAAKGMDPVPKYTPPSQAPAGFLRLLIGRVPVHTFGRTTNNKVLLELMPENEVWVNAITAKDFGLRQGQYVKLVNQDGVQSNRVRLKVTQRIHPECVYLPHGFGRETEKLTRAYRKGAADNPLLTRVKTDPLMGATSTNTNFVTFIP